MAATTILGRRSDDIIGRPVSEVSSGSPVFWLGPCRYWRRADNQRGSPPSLSPAQLIAPHHISAFSAKVRDILIKQCMKNKLEWHEQQVHCDFWKGDANDGFVYLEGRGQAWHKDKVVEYLFSFRPVAPQVSGNISLQPSPMPLLGRDSGFPPHVWHDRQLYGGERLMLSGSSVSDVPAGSRTLAEGTIGIPPPADGQHEQAFRPFSEHFAVGCMGTAGYPPPYALPIRGAGPDPARDKIDILSDAATMASSKRTAESAERKGEATRKRKSRKRSAAAGKRAKGVAGNVREVV